ncbi:MAG TPA: hypothetical protein VFC22_03090 [Solirubrobacteraceae bacterium]|nr:hypothetical protein [Solirubrobacteraceae bacterium]
MAEQSHRDEMNAAIRAQRERHAAPRTIAPADEAAPEPAPEAQEQPPEPPSAEPPRKSLFDRLRGR